MKGEPNNKIKIKSLLRILNCDFTDFADYNNKQQQQTRRRNNKQQQREWCVFVFLNLIREIREIAVQIRS